MQEFVTSGAEKTSTQFRKYLKMETAHLNNQNSNYEINQLLLKKTIFMQVALLEYEFLYLKNSGFMRSNHSESISCIWQTRLFKWKYSSFFLCYLTFNAPKIMIKLWKMHRDFGMRATLIQRLQMLELKINLFLRLVLLSIFLVQIVLGFILVCLGFLVM